MRKKVMLCLVASLILIFTAGCSAKKSEAKGNLNILLDLKNSESADIIQKLAEEYKSKNPDIDVKVSAALGTITPQELEKEKADILFTTRRTMLTLAEKGCLGDMKSYYEENKIDERYNKIVKSYGRYNDKEYGIPLNLSPLQVYFNTDALKKLNLSLPSNVSELYNVFSALKSKSVEIPVEVREEKYLRSQLFSDLVNNTVSVSKFEENFDSGSEAYKNIDMKEPFDTLKDMVRKNIVGEYSFVKAGDGAVAKLAKGDIPVMIGDFVNMNELSGNNIKTFENFSGIVPVVSDSVATVPINSKNGKQAEGFIKYIFSDDTQKKLVEMGYISGSKALNKDAKGTAAAVNKHMMDADEKNIIFTDVIPEKFLDPLESRLDMILSGRFSTNEWDEVINSAY